MEPDAALAVCRFLHDASAMLLWGAYAYLSMLVPKHLAYAVGRRLQAFRILSIVVAVVTTAAALPLEAGMIGAGWLDAVDATTIRSVLFETSVGQAWQLQAAAALILFMTLAIPARICQATTALASGLLVASLALTGHAVMREGWLGIAHCLNDILHVLSGGAWLGALAALLPILSALKRPEQRLDAGLALRRFSTAGHIAVVLVVASGVINTILVLGRWPTDWSSPYQALIACKIAVVAVMIVLAIVNRYGLVPQLARQRPDALRAIRLGTAVEIALGFCAVGLVSVFGMLEPS